MVQGSNLMCFCRTLWRGLGEDLALGLGKDKRVSERVALAFSYHST